MENELIFIGRQDVVDQEIKPGSVTVTANKMGMHFRYIGSKLTEEDVKISIDSLNGVQVMRPELFVPGIAVNRRKVFYSGKLIEQPGVGIWMARIGGQNGKIN